MSLSTGMMEGVNPTELFYFVPGLPGSGKPILGRETKFYQYRAWPISLSVTNGSISSLVIDTLCDHSIEQKVAVACFYYDFQDQKTQTPENVLGALLKQLLRGLGAIPAEIDKAFQKAKSQVGGRGLRVHELLPLLEAALAPLERAFICIDAL